MRAALFIVFVAVFSRAADPRTEADELFRTGQYRESATAYLRLLQSSPNDPDLIDRAGQSLMHLGQFHQAVLLLRKEITLAPSRVEAKHTLAGILVNMNDLAEGEAVLSELIKADATDATALYYRGLLWYRNGYYPNAIGDLDRALAVRGPHALPADQANVASISRAISLQQNGQNKEAEVELKKCLALPGNSANLDLLLSYARVLDEAGRYLDALTQTQHAIDADPRNASAHLWRAIIFQHQGQIDKALPEAERARDLAPRSPAPHNLLVRLYRESGRAEDSTREADWVRRQEAIANGNPR